MGADSAAPPGREKSSLRERKRAATVEEIKSVALAQLMADSASMTLRGVAREVGMTVQSLYHYFSGRDELITALVTDAHNAVADTLEEQARRGAELPVTERVVAFAAAYRDWALANRTRFLLIYGTPVPGYRAPMDGPTTAAARRLAGALTGGLFGDWVPDEAAGVRLLVPDDGGALRTAAEEGMAGVPAPALSLGLELWARMHGLVMLEMLGHLPLPGATEVSYRNAMHRMAADLERIRVTGA